jgi:hypothetical protein
MPDLLTLISKWWKAIVALTVIVAAIALAILLSTKKQYLSVVTALPANSLGFDKARIFNNNIQGLYSSLGTPDELDPVVGTGKLDTLYIAIVKDFNLVQHYGVENKKDGFSLAVKYLKGNSAVVKDEFGQLRIKVWDVDPQMAALLAHGLFERLQSLHQYLQNQANENVLTNLEKNYRQISAQTINKQSGDSSQNPSPTSADELKEYQRLISEYNLMISTKPQVLLLVEDARPAVTADRPKVLLVFLVSLFGALAFGILTALFLESRKS